MQDFQKITSRQPVKGQPSTKNTVLTYSVNRHKQHLFNTRLTLVVVYCLAKHETQRHASYMKQYQDVNVAQAAVPQHNGIGIIVLNTLAPV